MTEERADGGAGRVVLVGAGPGDADLITLRGAAVLQSADVVVFDSLVSRDLLDWAPPAAERIDVGKRGHDAPTRSQDEINALIVARARAGATVVRLKGGDPFVYGRGGEEASACRDAGVACEIVPGVSSATAVAALAGIPVTDRRYAASVAIVTGHRDRDRPWTSIRWDLLATGADTLVILMGMRNLDELVALLCEHGRSPESPAAVVMEGATPRQRVVEASLAALPEAVRRAGLGAPAVVVVGDVVRLRAELGGMDRAPLFGCRVLVTRPADPRDELVGALRRAGAAPVAIPMTAIEAVPGANARVAAVVHRAAEYDALIFTSRNAVSRWVAALRAQERAPDALGRPVFCVGPATARLAREFGWPDVSLPRAGADADALAAEIERARGVRGRRFLFLRAERARDVIPERLRAGGATVDEVVLYRSVPAAVDVDALHAALLAREFDALTFASPSAVQSFAARLDEPSREAARAVPIAALGPTTAVALRAAGLPAAVVATEPTPGALVAALAQYRARQQ